MKKTKLTHYTGGWIVGNFKPSVFQTKSFEFAVKKYRAGDTDIRHFHKKASEITVIVSGVFLINGKKMRAGDVVFIKPKEISAFQCVRSGYTAVVKTRSIKNDKYPAPLKKKLI